MLNSMLNPYEKCPVNESDNYLLRLIESADAADLLAVYSDENAVPYFNSDNCDGDDFHYVSMERMQSAVEFWQRAYQEGWFVRWTIIQKAEQLAVGTIELFHRTAEDYFSDCGLLRLDLRSDYEKEACIYEILSLITPPAFELFHCRMVATKIPSFASERKKAAEKAGYVFSEEILKGSNDQKVYTDYYIHER